MNAMRSSFLNWNRMRQIVGMSCMFALFSLMQTQAWAQTTTCNPQACDTRAVFPVIQGGQKGAPILAQNGARICVDIRMENNPLPIESYGYTIKYDPSRLTLQSIQPGELVSDFLAADCNQPAPGTIVCSGFDDDAILSNASGVLATLCFIVTCPPGVTNDTSRIEVLNLRDGLLNMSACCNQVICSNPPQGPCPGAALYLTQTGIALGAPASAKSGDTFSLTVGIKEIPSAIDSFGFMINFDSTALQFVSATPGNLLANFSRKEAREIRKGVLSFTGANNVAVPALSSGALFQIVFRAQCVVGDTSALTLSGLRQDLLNVQTCNNKFVCKSCEPANCSGAALYIAQTGKKLGEKLREQDGDSVRFEVRIKSNPQSVAAYGFRLRYDPAVLTFGRVQRGALTNNFVASTARQLAPGTLMAAGFGTTAIPVNSDGALLQFVFGVKCNVGDSTELRLSDLSDDIASLTPCCNFFACAPCDHDGDLNTDKLLTPGDALCAFEIYLNGGALPASCDHSSFKCELVAADVNCDNSVTSRDALAIFSRALQNLPPQDCFAKPTASGSKHASPPQLLLRGTSTVSETLRVQLQVLRPQALSAFGVLLQYPAHSLQFIRVQRTTATQSWFALDGHEYLPGMALIGGFQQSELSAEQPTAIFEAVFVNRGATIDGNTFSVAHLTDDFANASFTSAFGATATNAAPRQFKLHQNYPNPLQLRFATQGTVIRYDLPADLENGSAEVEIIIYNIQGQIVKRLFAGRQSAGSYSLAWDGRDDAGKYLPTGTYQYRLRADNHVEKRKLVIVK